MPIPEQKQQIRQFWPLPKDINTIQLKYNQGVKFMWKQNRAILLAAAFIIVPAFVSAPANADTKVQVVAERYRDWDRDDRRDYREERDWRDRRDWNRDNNRRNWNRNNNRRNWNRNNDRRNWNRDNEPNFRGVRLPDGDFIPPNPQILPPPPTR